MANSGGAPENFGEYDVFADVSQHGSSVFDFFGSVGLSAHQMPPSILSYSLENGQQQLDTAMTYPFPVFSTAMNIDQPPPKTATGSAKKSDLAPQSAPTVNQTPQTAAQASSAKPEMVVKPTASAERKTVKKTIAKTLGPKAVRPPFPGQDMSLSTVSALPPNPKRSLAVFSAQSGVVTASGVGASSSSPPNEGTGMSPSPSAVTQLGAGQDIHNSHTRRCRAKVNNKFAELLQILPTPPPKTGVKHKAQILDYTIRVFREIYAKKLYLEAELALSSRTHLNNWVESIVRPATVLADVLNPFMSLLCTKEKFAYAESWVRVEPTEGGRKGGILPRGTADSSAQSRGQFVRSLFPNGFLTGVGQI